LEKVNSEVLLKEGEKERGEETPTRDVSGLLDLTGFSSNN
jgi:hypothetical protein